MVDINWQFFDKYRIINIITRLCNLLFTYIFSFIEATYTVLFLVIINHIQIRGWLAQNRRFNFFQTALE